MKMNIEARISILICSFCKMILQRSSDGFLFIYEKGQEMKSTPLRQSFVDSIHGVNIVVDYFVRGRVEYAR